MRADEYRARAEECERTAQQFPNFGAKNLYEDLARQWRTLAEEAERRERAEQN
jgi:hypothetical protein